MTGKLDKSLDEILSSNRVGGRSARRPQRRVVSGRAAASAPAGGIRKVQRTVKPAKVAVLKAAPTRPANMLAESKIMISNLPKDVTESMIKDYFQKTVCPVKKTEILCGPTGESRGMAFVTFVRSDGASKAFKSLNGLLVDNRPIKIEIIVGDSDVEKIIPIVKKLSERVSAPSRAQPRSAASDRRAAVPTKSVAGQRKLARRRSVRPSRKSKEELDAEMADYFDDPNSQPAATTRAGGAGQPATADAATDDGIL